MEISRILDYSIGAAVIIVAVVIAAVLINKKLKDLERLRKMGGV